MSTPPAAPRPPTQPTPPAPAAPAAPEVLIRLNISYHVRSYNADGGSEVQVIGGFAHRLWDTKLEELVIKVSRVRAGATIMTIESCPLDNRFITASLTRLVSQGSLTDFQKERLSDVFSEFVRNNIQGVTVMPGGILNIRR